MNTKAIDTLNIALMLVSCALAFVVPFELFLFSYAIIGPLHYLTEITWLHQRDYFTNGKFDYLWLTGFCALVFVFNFVATDHEEVATFLTYLAFAGALGFILFDKLLWKIALVVIAAAAGGLVAGTEPFAFLFAVFLPTLIHVFVFTGLFILLGALRNKSVTGMLSLAVFAACAASFFMFFPRFNFYQAGDYAQKALVESGFALVNQSVLYTLQLGETTREAVFGSDAGLGVMRFVAFAYTYHYLNWFSKSSVIKWHRMPTKWLGSVIVLWILAVGWYASDYRAGFIALFFLSTLHVFLEFPLNYRSVIGIGQELGKLAGIKRPVAVAKS